MAGPESPSDIRRAPGPRLSPKSERETQARAALVPLRPDERPAALRVAVVVAAVLAIGVLAGTLTIKGLAHQGGSPVGGAFIAVVLVWLAQGMYRKRYWAVLAFEALLAFQIVVTSLALVVADTLLAAGLCVGSVVLAGWLFWKLVRVMGRLQAGERASAPVEKETDEALR